MIIADAYKHIATVISFACLIIYPGRTFAFPEECANLPAPATFIEAQNIVCLPKVKASDHSGTRFFKASLLWLGPAKPNLFKLQNLAADTASDETLPFFSTDTATLTLPVIDIPKTYGTERYTANLMVSRENTSDAILFELTSAFVYINPDYIPNVTWKPYGMLDPIERRAVDILGQSLPYATLAEAVYNFENSVVDNWQLIEQQSNNSGMQAGVYNNQDNNELVLAFRGTETCDFPCSLKETKEYLLDAATDVALVSGEDSPQFNHALNYAQQVINRYPGRNIIVTGHSLGGGLAQAIGAVLGLKTFAFNSAPVPKNFLKKYPSQLTDEELHALIHVIADIRDPVSNTDETGKLYENAIHLAPLIQFDFKNKVIAPARLGELEALRLDRHSITRFIADASNLLTIFRNGW